MPADKNPTDKIHDLRRRAEYASARAERQGLEGATFSPDGVRKLLHDLDVYQAELELQNEDLRRTQREAELARDRYLHLYDFSPVGYLTLNERGFIVEANITAARLLGMDSSELLEKPFSLFLSQENADSFYLYLNSLFESQERSSCAMHATKKDGTSFQIELDGIAVRNNSDQSSQARIVINDITERRVLEEARKESEKKLAETNRRLRALMEALPVGVSFSEDASCTRITGNSCLLSQFEIGPDENISASAIDPDAPGRLVRFFREGREVSAPELPLQRAVTENRVIPPTELEVRLRSGRRWYTEASGAPVVDDQGNVIGGVAVTVDISERKRVELALRESEERLRLFIEHAPTALAMFDRDMRYLAVSRRWIQDYHVGEKSLIGQSYYDVFPGNPDRWKEALQKGLIGEIVEADEDTFERADGSIKWLRWEIRPWYTGDGSIGGIVVFNEDITERKEAERELLVRDAAIKSSINGIGFAHPDGTIFYVNDALMKMWRTENPEEVVGLHVSEFWDNKEAFFKAFEEFQNLGRYIGELKAKRREGTTFDAQISASTVFDDEGKPLVIMASIIDISDRIKAEEELRIGAERLKEHAGMLEQAQVIVRDWNNRIVYWNEGVERLYGFTKSQAIGRDARKLLRTVFKESEAEIRSRLLREERWSGELQRLTAEGNPIFVAGHWFLVRDDAGRPVRIIESDNDITDLKTAEQSLKESEALSHAVFESTDDAIYLKDCSLRFQHVNSAFCRLIGLPAEKIIGKTAKELFGEKSGKAVHERESRVLDGESIDLEHRVTHQKTVMIFHDVVVPLRGTDGSIIGVYCLSRNITDRKTSHGKNIPANLFYPSPAMQKTFHDALFGAKSESIILLQGESGSGKDFLARWIHDESNRSKGPFFTVNCAALPLELAESELFGHERGAFTGSQGMKRGLLELAEGGTILLNEIGELSLQIQSKLLAFLDTRSFVRVGGEKHIHVNARLIAASHRDLWEEVEEERFLEPLFYRLSVFPIRVPPLRERMEDLATLVKQLLTRMVEEMQLKKLPVVDSSLIASLKNYDWPGNVRELRNVLERSLMLWHDGPLVLSLPACQRPTWDTSDLEGLKPHQNLQEAIDEVVFSFCEREVRASGGNKKEAAKRLGISRDTLYRYLKRLDGRRGNPTQRHDVSE